MYIIASLKDLQEMAKSGEFSKKLLEDEKFKTKLKETLKKEYKVEITDDDIPEIIKNLEENLKEIPDDAKVKQVLSKEAAENVSGGVSKAKIIKGVSTVAGFLLGAGFVGKKMMPSDQTNLEDRVSNSYLAETTGDPSLSISTRMKTAREYLKEANEPLKEAKKNLKNKARVTSVSTGILTGTGGYCLADYLCKKFDIK